MRRSLPPLGALRAFEAAARHASFKKAASELAVTPTAVSHQIKLLEETLGRRLFERRTRHVALTTDGQTLYPVLQNGFNAFDDVWQRLTGQNRRRTLTLSATSAFTAKWLVPKAAAFRQAHPGLDLRLHASEELADLAHGEADLAIRYGQGPFPGLVSAPLLTEKFAPLCSPALNVRTFRDLTRTPLLHAEWRRIDSRTPTWPHWQRAARRGTDDPSLRHLNTQSGTSFTDDNHVIEAAIAGHGIALLSLTLVSGEIARGLLVQPFGPVLDGYANHLVCTPGAAKNEDVKILRAWLADMAKQECPGQIEEEKWSGR